MKHEAASSRTSQNRRLLHVLLSFTLLLIVTLPSAITATLIEYDGLATNAGRLYEFNVTLTKVTRLCSTKYIPIVNGQFPGPTLTVREGDNVIVKVSNQLPAGRNVSIHWHGVRQLRNGWADGPGYITQCPLQAGTSYTYRFNITGQRGTLWWHAHLMWMRATIYGALIILPQKNVPYPFPSPDEGVTLIIGEWWKARVETVIKQAMQTGSTPNISDAYTINGQPGDLYPCSTKGTSIVNVESGKTYMLRLINAAMNAEMFVKLAAHNFTIVEADAVYTKPFHTDSLLITPGQTLNVLLNADSPVPGRFYLAARPYIAPNVMLDNTTTTAIVAYAGSNARFPQMPALPDLNDTSTASAFSTSLRGLTSGKVPRHVDRSLTFTVGLGAQPCARCTRSSRLVGAINNISFALPPTALLQAHYFRQHGVFSADFPDKPTSVFDFTRNPQPNTTNLATQSGTRLMRISFNTTVQLVLQGTSLIAPENHPVHLHGFNFFVVGQGFGNYNASSDPASFNLVDPHERNTVGVPQGGWVALRFRANNPGVWYMHCHLELHTAIGLDTALIVDNGPTAQDAILPPPKDLPPC